MSATLRDSAIEHYARRVDAVLAQRTRLRGPQPPGDLFGSLPPTHPLMLVDPRGPLDENLQVLASYVGPEDVLIDVGGGAGRMSLPLASRCREVINIDPSPGMGAAFRANAAKGGVENARFIESVWPARDPPVGTVALVSHVTYFIREIWPFLEQVERVGPERVLLIVGSDPPPPGWHRELFALLYGEAEEIVPSLPEMANVLWEQGRLPEIRVLPRGRRTTDLAGATREQAVTAAIGRFGVEQWASWPLGQELTDRLRHLLESRFEDLFAETPAGIVPRWLPPSRDVLITWTPSDYQ